jgi:hypothetical protein
VRRKTMSSTPKSSTTGRSRKQEDRRQKTEARRKFQGAGGRKYGAAGSRGWGLGCIHPSPESRVPNPD